MVEGSVGESQIRLVGRVGSASGSRWVLVVHHLLQRMRNLPWKVDISRQYFLRVGPAGEKLYYAWRLIFQGPTPMSEQIPSITQVMLATPRPSRVELTEIALGGSASRGQIVNGKGAGAYGTVAVGPAAVAMQRGGGF